MTPIPGLDIRLPWPRRHERHERHRPRRTIQHPPPLLTVDESQERENGTNQFVVMPPFRVARTSTEVGETGICPPMRALRNTAGRNRGQTKEVVSCQITHCRPGAMKGRYISLLKFPRRLPLNESHCPRQCAQSLHYVIKTDRKSTRLNSSHQK